MRWLLNIFREGKPVKLLDAKKANNIIRCNAKPGSEVLFGIREDWFNTAAELPKDAHIWSDWGTPCVEIDGVKFDCWKTVYR